MPLLVNGDRMTQAQFHRRYEAYPEDVKFELIGGIVYVASPVDWPHATYHTKLSFALALYAASTPGVEAGNNATMILGEESEPQPDLTLRIVAECGGQSWLQEGKYVQGAPEMPVEVAPSTRSMDLHQKKDDYRQAGVREYLVLCVEEQQLYWFRFPSGRLLKANRQGIYRSQVFPGLWIDGQALLNRDTPRLAVAVQQGLASREHAALERAGDIPAALARHGAAVRDGREFLDDLEEALRTNRDVDRWERYELDHRESLAIALTNEAELLTRLGKRSDAERGFRDALAQHEELARRVPINPEYPWSVAMTRTNLGVAFSAGPATRWPEAEEHFNVAAQWYKPAYERAPDDVELACYWAANRTGLAALKARQAFAAAALPDAAVNLYAETIKILEKAKESPEARLSMAEGLIRLGTVQRRAGRLTEAETALTRAREVLGPLYEEAPQGPGVAVLRALADGQLGKTFGRQGRRDDGQQLLNDAAARLDTLVKAYPEEQGVREARAENAFLRAGLAAPEADLAMRLLREAAEQGLFKDADRVRELQTDEDLAPLRLRQDFKELMERPAGGEN